MFALVLLIISMIGNVILWDKSILSSIDVEDGSIVDTILVTKIVKIPPIIIRKTDSLYLERIIKVPQYIYRDAPIDSNIVGTIEDKIDSNYVWDLCEERDAIGDALNELGVEIIVVMDTTIHGNEIKFEYNELTHGMNNFMINFKAIEYEEINTTKIITPFSDQEQWYTKYVYGIGGYAVGAISVYIASVATN